MLSLTAPKGSKCLCGKLAMATLMSADGQRELLPCCSACGMVGLEYAQRLRADIAGAALSPELRRWLSRDSGMSSKTIASVLVPSLSGIVYESGPRVPADPSDFGRCHRLLALIPSGVERMPEVAAAYPEWAGLVGAWAELSALYEEELPSGTAPKLYRRIKELTKSG